MQRVALIVIQEKIPAVRRRKICQPARNRAFAFGVLIGISDRDGAPPQDPRRPQRDFGSPNPSPRDGEWKKNVRVSDGVVVEVISCPDAEIIRIERPTAKRN